MGDETRAVPPQSIVQVHLLDLQNVFIYKRLLTLLEPIPAQPGLLFSP